MTTVKILPPKDIFKVLNIVIKIFDDLDVIDLMNAYDLSKTFQKASTLVIERKKISVLELRSNDVNPLKVLKIFGKHIKKLDILKFTEMGIEGIPTKTKYTDFDQMIEIITTYCSPGKLTELEISCSKIFSLHTEHILQQASQFFENVEKLTLRNLDINQIDTSDVEKLSNIFPLNNLRMLCIFDFFTGNWLNSPNLQSLQHLHIGRDSGTTDFTKFFEFHPDLRSFYCTYNNHIEPIARYAPNIEKIGNLIEISHKHRHCFSRLKSLKQVVIEVKGNGRVLFQVLKWLPAKYLLEILSLKYKNGKKQKNKKMLKNIPTLMKEFTSLKWLHLNNMWSRSDMFLLNFLPYLNTVRICSFDFCLEPQTHIQVVRFLKNVRFLIMDQNIDKEFYQKLMEAWKARQQEELFTYPIIIYLDADQYEINMNQSLSIYDQNIVRFDKCTREWLKSYYQRNF